jgi:hypothetical protein
MARIGAWARGAWVRWSVFSWRRKSDTEDTDPPSKRLRINGGSRTAIQAAPTTRRIKVPMGIE